MPTARDEDLERIRRALETAGSLLRAFQPGNVRVSYKARGAPVTDADHAVDDALRGTLPRGEEGWLSEETPDDPARLGRRRVWIVDPLDGTREFLAGTPEWCVSIGLVEDGVAVAGGIYNPSSAELFLGSRETGVTLNGRPVTASERTSLEGGVVLVSRWALTRRRPRVPDGAVSLRAVGALAYALALVAVGRAEAMWSRSAKPEWDIAAGAALITAAGGHATTWDGGPLVFNRWPPRAPGLVVTGRRLLGPVRRFIESKGSSGAGD